MNYADHASQCYVERPFSELEGRSARLDGALGGVSYDRDGSEVRRRGLYLDVPPFAHHVFDVREPSGQGDEDGTSLV